jgi:hypothetical protein
LNDLRTFIDKHGWELGPKSFKYPVKGRDRKQCLQQRDSNAFTRQNAALGWPKKLVGDANADKDHESMSDPDEPQGAGNVTGPATIGPVPPPGQRLSVVASAPSVPRAPSKAAGYLADGSGRGSDGAVFGGLRGGGGSKKKMSVGQGPGRLHPVSASVFASPCFTRLH